MIARETVLTLVTHAAIELNETLEDKIDVAAAEDAVLYGRDGVLDSLDLVNLILLVEEKAQKEAGKPVTLADDRAMSQFKSPFRTIGSLTDYVVALVA